MVGVNAKLRNYVITRCNECNMMKEFDWNFQDMMNPDFQNNPEFKQMMEFTLAHLLHDSYQITIKTSKANYKTIAAAVDKLISENLK
jgi:hypothetical protein